MSKGVRARPRAPWGAMMIGVLLCALTACGVSDPDSGGSTLSPSDFYASEWYFGSGYERSVQVPEHETTETAASYAMRDLLSHDLDQDGETDICILTRDGILASQVPTTSTSADWSARLIIPVATPVSGDWTDVESWDDLGDTGEYVCVMTGPDDALATLSIRRVTPADWQATPGGVSYPDQLVRALDLVAETLTEEPAEYRLVLANNDFFAWLVARSSGREAILAVAVLQDWPSPQFGGVTVSADRTYPLSTLGLDVAWPEQDDSLTE